MSQVLGYLISTVDVNREFVLLSVFHWQATIMGPVSISLLLYVLTSVIRSHFY